MKMSKRMKTNLILFSPVVVAGFSWIIHQYWLTTIAIIAIYLSIGLTDASKHASVWLFVLTGISSIPMNIELTFYASHYFSLLWGDAFVFAMKFLYVPLAFVILYSIEQIIVGITGRVLWREQDPVWD